MVDLNSSIRTIPDFPKPGIQFRDITTLLKDPSCLREAIDRLHDRYRDQRVDKVVAVESRGFILGGALAARLAAGFVPVRKPGKLPAPTISERYELEYGADTIEVHTDAIVRGDRILLHDDLLATGGTMQAACRLVQRLGASVVGISFLIELAFLHGRDRLAGYDVFSLITYDAE